MRNNRLVSIRYNSIGGKVRLPEAQKVKRLPRDKAAALVDQDKAVYISKTLFKAATFGVKVKPNTSDAQIKAAIKKAKAKPKPALKPVKEEVKKTKKSKPKRRRKSS